MVPIMAKPTAPKPWRRETPGRYVSADDRFAIDESAPSHWYVTDRDQPDELGQPRIRGPFASLARAREAAESEREAPVPASPLAGRIAAGQDRPRRTATPAAPPASGARPRSRPPRAALLAPTPPPEPAVRAARPTDAPAIARLWLELAGRLAAADPARFRRPADQAFDRSVAGHIADPGPDAAVFVVAAGEATVGFVAVRVLGPATGPERHVFGALDGTRAAVPALAVDAAWRHKGLERELLTRAEAWARERGAHAVSIEAADGLQAAALFRGAGYRESPPRFERSLDDATTPGSPA